MEASEPLPEARVPVAERAGDARPAGAVAPLAPVAPPTEHSASTPGMSLPDVVLALWAAGALVVLLRMGVRHARALALARRSRPLDDDDVLAVISAAAREAGVRRGRFQVKVSPAITSPAVCGFFRATVLVPPGATAWSPQRWRVVLLHELAHVRRHDCLTQLLADLTCALRWYDPLAWMCAKRLHAEREHAADDAVLASGARATEYAEHLLSIAKGSLVLRPHAALAMAERSELGTRVTALLEDGRARRPLGRAAAAGVAVASSGLAFVVACATPQDGVVVASSASKSEAPAPSAGAPATLLDAAAAYVRAPAAHVELTMNPALEAAAEEEVTKVEADWHADLALIVVLDPKDGAILAMAGRKGGASAPFLAATRSGSPGSTAKLMTFAAALDKGTIKEDTRVFCENGQRKVGGDTLHDAAPHAWLTASEVLAVSSNIGTQKRIAEMLPTGTVDALAHRLPLRRAPAGAASPARRPGPSRSESIPRASPARQS